MIPTIIINPIINPIMIKINELSFEELFSFDTDDDDDDEMIVELIVSKVKDGD
jgi:hypothetical protein